MKQDELMLWSWEKEYSKVQVEKIIKILVKNHIVTKQHGYISLVNREEYIGQRRERERISQKKIEKAKQISRWISLIPTVYFIGVTGAVAVGNAGIDDDIDVCIFAKKGTVWVTRLLTTVVVEIVAVRRHPNDREALVSNAICLNMFLAEDALAMPIAKRDIYTAHEVLQMVPLIDKGNIYQEFLKMNTWVERFLPSAWKVVKKHKQKQTPMGYDMMARVLERGAREIQKWYMKRRMTKEVVSDTVIRFHPRDARVSTLRNLKKKLESYKISFTKK